MSNRRPYLDRSGLPNSTVPTWKSWHRHKERSLLQELVECKRSWPRRCRASRGWISRLIPRPRRQRSTSPRSIPASGPDQARLGAVYRRYSELRSKLALAKFKLVAHVAKRLQGARYSLL